MSDLGGDTDTDTDNLDYADTFSNTDTIANTYTHANIHTDAYAHPYIDANTNTYTNHRLAGGQSGT